MNKYKILLIQKSVSYFLAPLLLLSLCGCPREESEGVKPATSIPDFSKEKKHLSLMVRLSQVQDANYEQLIKDFLLEHRSDTPLRLKLLRKRNHEGQNALHFLLSKSSSNLAPAKLVFDQDPKLFWHKDSYGSTPLDSFLNDTANLKSLTKLQSLHALLSLDFCHRLKDQDLVITKMSRLPESPERNEALIFAFKNGALSCLEKMGENYESAADILVADKQDGLILYNLMAEQGLKLAALDNARQKKKGQRTPRHHSEVLPESLKERKGPCTLKLAAINDYDDEYEQQKLPSLEDFLKVVKASINSGALKTPLHFKAGIHLIDAQPYEIYRAVRFLDQKILIMLDEVIYEGMDSDGNAFSKITAAYDAENGQHLVMREAEDAEFGVYEQLKQNPQDGVVAVYATIKEQRTNLVFLKRYNAGNLYNILWDISDAQCNELAENQKKQLARTLLEGLKNLHDLKIAVEVGKNRTQILPFSHRDLKPENIFCEHLDTPQFSCVIGDFDTAVAFEKISGTYGYFSPEDLDLIQRFRAKDLSEADIIAFNTDHGQKSDIWTLGQILSSILSSRKNDAVELPAVNNTLVYSDDTVANQRSFEEEDFRQLAQEWLSLKILTQDLETLRLWDTTRLMLQKDPTLRPDAAEALHLLNNKNVNYIMGQPFKSVKQMTVKKLVGGLFHYCYIDMTDKLHCEDKSSAQEKEIFPGLDQVASIPASIANKPVKDLIAGPFNTCAILMDDSIQCFGRLDPEHDLRALNGGTFKNVIVNHNAVIAIDNDHKVKSSPEQEGLNGLSCDPTTTVWGATPNFLYHSDETGRWSYQALSIAALNVDATLYGAIIGPEPEKSSGRAKIVLGSHDHIYGLTKNAYLISTQTEDDLRDIFSFNLEQQSFAAMTMVHGLDKAEYKDIPYVRTNKDITLTSGQKIKAGAWVGGNAHDPTWVIGDDDGVYDDILIGERYRCLKQGGTYYCDR